MAELPTLDEAAAWQASVYDDLPEYDPDDPNSVRAFVWEAYTQGDCRVYALTAAWLLNMRAADCGPHAVVLDADGRMYDASGEVTEDDVRERYFSNPNAKLNWRITDRDDVEEALDLETLPIDPLPQDDNVRAAIGALVNLDTPLREIAREKAEKALRPDAPALGA